LKQIWVWSLEILELEIIPLLTHNQGEFSILCQQKIQENFPKKRRKFG
jgi:hypothetical protein